MPARLGNSSPELSFSLACGSAFLPGVLQRPLRVLRYEAPYLKFPDAYSPDSTVSGQSWHTTFDEAVKLYLGSGGVRLARALKTRGRDREKNSQKLAPASIQFRRRESNAELRATYATSRIDAFEKGIWARIKLATNHSAYSGPSLENQRSFPANHPDHSSTSEERTFPVEASVWERVRPFTGSQE
ncbi:hypothetical protein DFH06DRAFT_1145695 [Mycena polygramma]|nr:hypothetical protein DFH06DRAFT_1145695 [Mycena polygramma]